MTHSDRTRPMPNQPDDPSLRPVSDALHGLLEAAPRSVANGALVTVGLVDALATFESAIGPLVVAWNGRGVTMVDVADDPGFEDRHARQVGRPIAADVPMPDRLRRAIERRLSGDRRVRVPLDLRGRAPFEQAVWMKALEIPPGEVRPYGWIAAEIGNPKAVRAVGSALGRNPVPLIVPCHRVVRTDGTIGQYSLGGPGVKRRVLSSEGVDLGELERLATHGIRFFGSDTTHIVCHPTCRHARRVTDRHRVTFPSLEAAAAAGYRPCRVCRPVSVAA